MKHFFKEWGLPIAVLAGAAAGLALLFLLIRLCFPSIGPKLERISFEEGATVYARTVIAEGEWEDVPLSEEESEAVIAALNACGLWTSNTCDCADGVGLGIGEQRVRWLEDHFHYIGEDLCVEIPKRHLDDLNDILSPYLSD